MASLVRAARRACLLALLPGAGCQRDLAQMDQLYYAGGERPVHCAVNVDAKDRVSFASIDGGLDRAQQRGEILELYSHEPGVTVPIKTLDHVLAGAQQRGLYFNTYADFAAGTWRVPGLALSFDDAFIDEWASIRPLLQQYGARVTFFVTRYPDFTDAGKAELQQLAADGHAIEAHTISHQRGPTYVEDHGLAAYLADEVQPSIDLLVADGYPVTAFAYPFGARTDETDQAILGRVGVLRAVTFTFEGVSDPCPL